MFEIGTPNILSGSLMLLLGTILALALGWLRARKAGIPARNAALACVLAPLLAALCAHLGYCLACVTEVIYSQPIGFWFAFWQNGQLFYGGMLGALLALSIAGGKDRIRLIESCMPSIALMVVFARLAEGCFGQGYGEYWYGESTLLCRLPFMVYDPYYESWAWALFMAEAAVALVLFIFLLKRKPAFDGDSALLFFGFYAAVQVVMESLRRDEFLRWGFVRVEELFSAVVMLVVLILYWKRTGKAHLASKIACMAVFVGMIVFTLLLEFATEGRIDFLAFLDVWHCYALMAVCSVINAACILIMRQKGVLRS